MNMIDNIKIKNKVGKRTEERKREEEKGDMGRKAQ